MDRETQHPPTISRRALPLLLHTYVLQACILQALARDAQNRIRTDGPSMMVICLAHAPLPKSCVCMPKRLTRWSS